MRFGDNYIKEEYNMGFPLKRETNIEDNVQVAGNIHPGQNGTIYNTNGVAPTICAGEGVKCNTKIAKLIILGMLPDERRHESARRVYDPNGIAPTQNTCGGGGLETKIINNQNYRICKLTPRECFRLMGVSDADIDKIQAAGISKSQQYKMAGNSIVVNCLAAIFRNLLIGNYNKNQQLELF